MSAARRLLVSALLPVWLVACRQPPSKEIAAAEAQMELARQAGADRFSPNEWREAETALEDARAKVQAGDYRAALSSANDAGEKARAAARAAAPAKGAVRAATERTLAEIRSLLDQVAAARKAATRGRVADEATGDLEARLEEAQEGLQRAAEMVDHGDVIDAQKAASEIKAQVAGLAEAYRQASTRGRSDHSGRTRK